jgi:hypothetical protein
LPALSLARVLPLEERGFYGRIAMSKDNFMKLGGYDEHMKGWGREDGNLIMRALAMGLVPQPFYDASFMGVIAHSTEERLANCAKEHKQEAAAKIANTRQGMIKKTFNMDRLWFTFNSLTQLRRNEGRFGMGTITTPDGQKTVLGVVDDKNPLSTPRVIKAGIEYAKLIFRPIQKTA